MCWVVGVLWGDLVHAGIEAGLLQIVEPVHHGWRIGHVGYPNTDRYTARENVRSVFRGAINWLPISHAVLSNLKGWFTNTGLSGISRGLSSDAHLPLPDLQGTA